MYRKIVVALNGSQRAEAVLPYIAALAAQFGSRVTLVQATMPRIGVVPPPTARTGSGETIAPTGRVSELQRREALIYLGSIAHELIKRGVDAEIAHDEGVAAEVILRTAQRLQADLIAMTTHGAGGLRRLVLGSVADAVLRNVPCPLLLVHVEQEADKIAMHAGGERP